MAAALDLDIRTYERLAAGRTRLDPPRLFALAEVLDADPLGLVAALKLEDPRLAEATADTKLLFALALALARLPEGTRERLARASALNIADACDRLLADLARAPPP